MLNFFDSIDTSDLSFSTSKEFINELPVGLKDNDNPVQQIEIGHSEENRPIHAFVAGWGDKHIALLGGAHSDEPVGPQMLRLLVDSFIQKEEQAYPLLKEYTFVILPHINPDGEAKNWEWIKKWPDMAAYVKCAFREKPGRDLEFGYPDMRRENKAVSELLQKFAPFELYINFHGMAVAEGIMLLIERHWIERTQKLRNDFRSIADTHNLPLHDHDRGGEKGFRYIGPGFTTTPEGRAMQQHFKEKGDEETASKFHLSSMEYVRSLGGDPLCLVTELPLYIVQLKKQTESEPGVPQAYLEFKEQLPKIRRRVAKGKPLTPLLNKFEINQLSLHTAANIQLSVIQGALKLLRD